MTRSGRYVAGAVVVAGLVAVVLLAVTNDPLWLIGVLVLFPLWLLALGVVWVADLGFRTWRTWHVDAGL